MIRATGITAEYNPLHNGHVYHLEKARELTGCGAVVTAMSGDFVQRGEPAIMDKWKRTELALRGGADLVIEIPVLYCLGNAGQYAGAGVKLLESLGCVDHIAFGSECGDTDLLVNTADFLKENASDIASEIQSIRKTGYSYPAARSKAYGNIRRQSAGADEEMISRELKVLESSNDILSLEYILAMHKASPLAIKREGAGYSDPYDIRFRYQSATALRAQVLNGSDISGYVPDCTAGMLRKSDLRQYRADQDQNAEVHLTGPDRDKWFDILRYAVLSTPAEIIEDCPSGGEGLSNLMKSEILRAGSWTQFARRVKSKRYTYTRIMRLCAQVVLGITRKRFDTSDGPGYVRVLGFTDRGRELLSEIKKHETSSLTVITNINKERELLDSDAAAMLDLDIHAADIYNLASGADPAADSDHRRSPVIIR